MKKKILVNNLKFLLKKNKFKYLNSIKKVLNKGTLILGDETQKFEKNFSKFTNSKFCISCANGTDALQLALSSLNLKENNRILLSANAGFYACSQILKLGLKFKFCDIENDYFGPSLKKIQESFANNIKVIIITHLYGIANKDILKIRKFCKKRSVILIEDCSQAVGVRINGKHVGTFGDIATFSFYPTKNLGSLGDAGALICKSKKIYKRLMSLKQYGWKKKYIVNISGGVNSRLDEIQAAVLNINLRQINLINKEKKRIANFYLKNIKNKKIAIINPKPYYNGHLFVILVNNRYKFIRYLKSKNIRSEIHYPILDYNQKIIKKRFKKLYLTNSENISKKILSLPNFNGISINDLKKITDVINAW
jgi:dTDP-3-amino-2,3,6-trideoxy-4-keto-D-glucose/dTDP-3-amino-3,4,6-trideoxy-alpha-D-glucose/dTDP-2,6-dideoxy-D-kanosamine transaminase